MIEELPRLVMIFVVILLVAVVGLGLGQQSLDTVKFPAPTAINEGGVIYYENGFNGTALNFAESISNAFSWLPMLILAGVGGIAIAYVFGFTNIMNRQQ